MDESVIEKMVETMDKEMGKDVVENGCKNW